MNDLYRQEAVDHATRRLEGAVVLAVPVRQQLLATGAGAIVLIASAFLVSTSYARKATVSGWLVPDTGIIRVVSQSSGIVSQVIVQEGQFVKRGDRIAEIRLSTETNAGNSGDRLAQSQDAEGRALRDKTRAQIDRLNNEMTGAGRRLQNLDVELDQARSQVKLQEQRVSLAQRQVTAAQKLVEQGYVTRKEYDTRIAAVLAAEQDLAGLRRQVVGIERDIAELQGRVRSIPLEIETAKADLQQAEASLQQRSIDSETRRKIFVTAPVEGRVSALPVATGQAAAAGTTIAVLTPEGGRLEAELLAPTRSIGFVRTGQEVHLMLQAFPYQRFGTVKGTVRTLSSTVLAPSEVAVPGLMLQEPVFRLRVTLTTDAIEAYGERIALQPGMLLSANVIFDRRSLFEWLFDPILAVGRRA
jgi:membrane fusion protein